MYTYDVVRPCSLSKAFVIVNLMIKSFLPSNTQEHLENLAQEIVTSITKPSKLLAVLLQGSVAKGIADEYSDIELMCIWSSAPTAEERANLFANLKKQEIFSEDLENGEWCSSFSYKQAKIDICHDDIALLHQTIDDVMAARTTSIASQTLLASIQDAKPLFGEEVFNELLKSFANYPDALAIKCIQVNALFHEWTMRNALLDRKDTIALHHLIDMTVLQMLRLIFAFNKVYLRNYNFKWMDVQLPQLECKPVHLDKRLRSVLSGLSENSLSELTALLNDTIDLASQQYPKMDFTEAKKILDYTRQSN